MGFTLRLFGIPVLSLEITGDGSAEEYISLTGGSFELAPEEPEYDEEYYEEDRSGFGFGVG
ncbi:minor tail protein [Mycobacterium phage terelak]|uniref:Minor tail protein n=1 Tax=Mycobacterium phage Euphoria TaxID=2922223 RepID=G1EV78_9CAUD|nr:minor tail protein [Mycobacterium phage Euphoria]YP_009201041.1 minor tail protein [Mycobacterium phage TheloniousMonk]AXH67639.1 hypothetical protein SEA_ARLO_25 [Mycobacterium phage Arlo]WGH20227.1 hypothetical protein SLAGATHOR_27 [Mycobacterium phage Slagathor]WRQ09011.1 minor tail protein [Mycobacterium phage terelak]AEJ93687.1 hypothetical protein EUPHORIA_26 [Mycobacterium phage Euphoria]ALA06170.1 hypothetical protein THELONIOUSMONK_28 [Mycobacterium phage TheloniousMonk]